MGDRGRRDDPPPLRATAPAARSRVSQISAGRKNSLQWEIDGSDGGGGLGLARRPTTSGSATATGPNEILLRNPALMGPAGRAAAALPGGHVEGFGDTFGALFRADLRRRRSPAVRSRTRRMPTFADGHDEMLVNDAIALSAREGRWVDVDRTTAPASPAGPPRRPAVAAHRSAVSSEGPR